jgi:hypothetical protein
MNDDWAILNCTRTISDAIQEWSDLIDEDNLLAILIGIAKEIGDIKGYRKKDFREKLKQIIDFRER